MNAPTKFRTPSDAELRTRQFVLSDPEELRTLPGRRLSLPDPSVAWEIDRYYDIARRPGEEREFEHCCKCNRSINYGGVILLFEDGSRCLIGKDCAEKHYGADFRSASTSINEQRRRSLVLRLMDRANDAFPDLLIELQDLQKSPEIEIAASRFRQFRDGFPDLHSYLVSDGGRLVVERQVRDEEGERERDRKLDRAMRREAGRSLDGLEAEEINRLYEVVTRRSPELSAPITRPGNVEIGRAAGAGFVIGKGNFSALLEQSLTKLREIWRQSLAETDDVDVKQLRRINKSGKQAAEEVAALIARINQLPEFMTPLNLQTIAAWANERVRSKHHRVEDGDLVGPNGRLSRVPPDFRIANLPQLNAFTSIFD